MLHVEKMSFDLGERLGLRTMYLHHLPTMLPTELTFSHVACSMTSFRFQFSRIVKGSRVLTTELLRKMIDSCVLRPLEPHTDWTLEALARRTQTAPRSSPPRDTLRTEHRKTYLQGKGTIVDTRIQSYAGDADVHMKRPNFDRRKSERKSRIGSEGRMEFIPSEMAHFAGLWQSHSRAHDESNENTVSETDKSAGFVTNCPTFVASPTHESQFHTLRSMSAPQEVDSGERRSERRARKTAGAAPSSRLGDDDDWGMGAARREHVVVGQH